jgi:peptidyl-prolyl cis-trans isomerase NIMA-interacting 1
MLRSLLLSTAILSLSLPACSAAPAAPPKAASATAETPAEACLRAASAKREKRPNEPARISAKHVLVKYYGAKGAKPAIARTREEACLRAIEARDKLRGGADFGKVVIEYSEEPGAASREGSVGSVERSDMVPPFADAAFELDIQQLSDVVESDFGFHVILRTE